MKSTRTPMNTQRVSSTGVARGTTTVTIAESAVNSTTRAPTGSSRTARAVVTWPALLSSSPAPSVSERPDRLAEPVARHPHAVAARARHVHDPVQEPPPALRPGPIELPARGDARLREHLLHPRRKLRRPEVPQPPPSRTRRQERPLRPRAVFHASSSPSPRPGPPASCPIAPARAPMPIQLGSGPELPYNRAAQAGDQSGWVSWRHRLVWSMAPACYAGS